MIILTVSRRTAILFWHVCSNLSWSCWRWTKQTTRQASKANPSYPNLLEGNMKATSKMITRTVCCWLPTSTLTYCTCHSCWAKNKQHFHPLTLASTSSCWVRSVAVKFDKHIVCVCVLFLRRAYASLSVSWHNFHSWTADYVFLKCERKCNSAFSQGERLYSFSYTGVSVWASKIGMEKEREGAKDALMELCKCRRPRDPLAKYSTRDVDRTAVYNGDPHCTFPLCLYTESSDTTMHLHPCSVN